MRLPEPIIKVCGVRDRAVLEAALHAGASAIGFNFVSWSRRRIEPAAARELRAWAREQQPRFAEVQWVGVFADPSLSELIAARDAVGIGWAQVHGELEPDTLAAWRAQIPTIRAVGLSDDEDVARVMDLEDPQVLVDARRPDGRTGGTGTSIDPALLEAVCGRGGVIVAGGLRAHTVAEVVARCRPAGVDTASGAEDEHGHPSPDAAAAFVRAAREAYVHSDSDRDTETR